MARKGAAEAAAGDAAAVRIPERVRPYVGPAVVLTGLVALDVLRHTVHPAAVPLAMVLVLAGLAGTATASSATATLFVVLAVVGHYAYALAPLGGTGAQIYLLMGVVVTVAALVPGYVKAPRSGTPEPQEPEPSESASAQLLADASALFDLSLGAAGLLERAGRLAVPLLGDWCAAYMVDDNGAATRRRVSHANPALEELLEYALESAPLRPAEPHPLVDVHEVIRTGDPLIKAVAAPVGFMAFARIPADREVMHSLEPRSLLMVPMFSQGECVGALAFARTTDARPYQLQELTLAMAFGERIALALTNAQRLEDAVAVGSGAVVARDRMAGMLESISNGFIVVDTSATVTYVNREAEHMLGLTRQQLLGRELWSSIRLSQSTSSLIEACRDVQKWDRPTTLELLQSWTGEPRWTEIQLFPLETGVSMCLRDVTVRRRLQDELKQREDELQRSQRMEAIGRLAGGVAHDFNNILMSIAGYTEMLMAKVGDDPAILDDLAEVRRSTDRAASLTRQLLMYSRRQANQPRVIDLGAVLTDLEKMLVRLLGEDILLTVRVDKNVRPVLVDRSQIEQVVLNLAVNARDAMPVGGRLTIELAPGSGEAVELEGDTVLLTVADTGTGIDADALPHIFEPFFTTKETGTGLGLASVYGIIKQNRGSISVHSTVGRGTTFRVHLPVAPPSSATAAETAASAAPPTAPDTTQPTAAAETAAAESPPSRPKRARGSTSPGPAASAQPAASKPIAGVILVAEDEESVRKFICTVLRGAGHTVLDARNGVEGLAVAARHQGTIDLLLTDLIMPEMGGRQLAERLLAARPGLRILFISGYADNAQALDRELEAGAMLLDKPFASDVLLAQVQEMLAAPPQLPDQPVHRASPFGSRKSS